MNDVQIREIIEYMRMAYDASHRSDDPDTQNGAVLEGGGRVVAVACNTLPNGVLSNETRLHRPEKYKFMVHAEAAVVLRAAAIGRSTSGTTLICPYAACHECVKSIITAGVTAVIRHTPCMNRMPDRWVESVRLGDMMLREAGVTVVDFDYPIGDTHQLFDGEIWYP